LIFAAILAFACSMEKDVASNYLNILLDFELSGINACTHLSLLLCFAVGSHVLTALLILLQYFWYSLVIVMVS